MLELGLLTRGYGTKASCTDGWVRRDRIPPFDPVKGKEAAALLFISLPPTLDITTGLILHLRSVSSPPQLPRTSAERPRTENAHPVPAKY